MTKSKPSHKHEFDRAVHEYHFLLRLARKARTQKDRFRLREEAFGAYRRGLMITRDFLAGVSTP